MSFSTNSLRQFIAATDSSRPSLDTLNYSNRTRTVSAAVNAIDCATEAANCIPGVSFFTGIGTMVYGAVKLGLSAVTIAGDRDIAFMFFKSGATSIGLGAAAAFLPGPGWYLNAVAAGKDAVDVGNMIAP